MGKKRQLANGVHSVNTSTSTTEAATNNKHIKMTLDPSRTVLPPSPFLPVQASTPVMPLGQQQQQQQRHLQAHFQQQQHLGMMQRLPQLSPQQQQFLHQARMSAVASLSAAAAASIPPHQQLLQQQPSSVGTSPNNSNSSPGLVSSPEDKINSSSGSNSSSSGGETPMSRTNQYKKIMKPLLERKRRARINKCLDELKDIMTVALQAQGENVSKLEKADILELTVRHLHKLQKSEQLMTSPSPRNPLEEVHRFQAGYSSCAQEAASFLLSSPGVDVRVSQRLLTHLTTNIASGPFVPQQQPPPRPQLLPCSTPVVPNMFQTPPKFSGVPTTASPTTFPLSRTSSPVTRPLHGLHSPPVVSLERKVTPPPRPNSNPNLSTAANASCHFTVKIMKTEKGAAAHAPIKPEPIRLNPNDPVWRPF